MLSVLAALIFQSVSPQIDTVDDVVVIGRQEREQVEEFVAEVAAPAGERGLATWRSAVCVGVVNLRRETATAMVDHIAEVAARQGLRVGAPGCSPNVIVTFSDDGRGLAAALVERQPRVFRPPYAGAAQDRGALQRFTAGTRPVRWWHVSVPHVGATGQIAVRMPGDAQAPFIPGEGRVNKGRPIADALVKAIIIVDAPQVERYSGVQLGDYLAFVALAQIEPEAEVAGANTILNLFDGPGAAPGLTSWDRSYLAALYDTYPERIDRSDQASAMFRQVRRDRADPAVPPVTTP